MCASPRATPDQREAVPYCIMGIVNPSTDALYGNRIEPISIIFAIESHHTTRVANGLLFLSALTEGVNRVPLGHCARSTTDSLIEAMSQVHGAM